MRLLFVLNPSVKPLRIRLYYDIQMIRFSFKLSGDWIMYGESVNVTLNTNKVHKVSLKPKATFVAICLQVIYFLHNISLLFGNIFGIYQIFLYLCTSVYCLRVAGSIRGVISPWQVISDIVSFVSHRCFRHRSGSVVGLFPKKIGEYWLVIQERRLGRPTSEIWPKLCRKRRKTTSKQVIVRLHVHIIYKIERYLFKVKLKFSLDRTYIIFKKKNKLGGQNWTNLFTYKS